MFCKKITVFMKNKNSTRENSILVMWVNHSKKICLVFLFILKKNEKIGFSCAFVISIVIEPK